GNGGEPDQKWTGRSVRIGCINASRGVGCFIESLSHGMEGNATSDAIPYFSKYFKEYGGYDLDKRFQLPFTSFYSLPYGVIYRNEPDKKTLVVTYKKKEYRVKGYVAIGGNAHWPPNGRQHYDLDNSAEVMSTIEDWRIGSGAGGKDRAIPWTNARFRNYR